MTNQRKNCPHCGSTSTLPIAYGLMSDETHQENAKERKYVWGGCVIHSGTSATDYCKDCKKHYDCIVNFWDKNLDCPNC